MLQGHAIIYIWGWKRVSIILFILCSAQESRRRDSNRTHYCTDGTGLFVPKDIKRFEVFQKSLPKQSPKSLKVSWTCYSAWSSCGLLSGAQGTRLSPSVERAACSAIFIHFRKITQTSSVQSITNIGFFVEPSMGVFAKII